jgi:alkylation response protein AidB-like acyl-CoA dehydrogenase
MNEAMQEAYFTEEHRLFREQYRRFLEREVAPLVDEAEENEHFPRVVYEKLGRQGYIGLHVKEEHGGAGAGYVMAAIAAEEMARVCSGFGASVGVCTIAANPIMEVGTPAQRERYVRPVLQGRMMAAIAMTEPDVGSDFKAIRTQAKPTQGGWVLNGSKTFITNGPIADYVVVCARTEQRTDAKGVSLFIVERGTPGFTVARKLKKLGWRSSETGELAFQDCFVPDDKLVGEPGTGFYTIMKNLSYERMVSAAGSLGLSAAAFEAALAYAKERKQFGKPIGQFQMIRKLLADMHTRVAAARHLAYDAASKMDRGLNPVTEVTTAKYHNSEMAKLNATDALQIHGGNGFMMEYAAQRYLRDSQVGTIGAGTSQVMVEILAKQMGL